MKELNPNKFKSPIPIIFKLKNILLGKSKPDIYTQINFTINLVICMIFMFWNIMSYFIIKLRTLIFEYKGIQIEKIIKKRGLELGFESIDFLPRLITFHSIGIICWTLVFFGLIILYRKKKNFSLFILGGITFYIGMSIFYLNWNYFIKDTTAFDKIALLVLITSIIIHVFLTKHERLGNSINFFGENLED